MYVKVRVPPDVEPFHIQSHLRSMYMAYLLIGLEGFKQHLW